MLSPSVSGAQGYKELATAAKGEELRLVALKHHHHYSKPTSGSNSDPSSNRLVGQSTPRPSGKNSPATQPSVKDTRRCYTCGETGGHLVSKCPQTKQESSGRPAAPVQAKQGSGPRHKCVIAHPSPESLLLSSEEPNLQVKVTQITDHIKPHPMCEAAHPRSDEMTDDAAVRAILEMPNPSCKHM